MTSTINKPLDGEGSVQVKQDPKIKKIIILKRALSGLNLVELN